jgi:hypothetical protein
MAMAVHSLSETDALKQGLRIFKEFIDDYFFTL